MQNTIMTLLGTRPEVIKLAPVVRALEQRPSSFRSVVVRSGQHLELADPFINLFGIRVESDLKLMRPGQSPTQVAHRLLKAIEPELSRVRPSMLLVQGDTTTAMAGALAAFYAKIPVGHVEAGLRTETVQNPFPEEINRRLITQLTSLHFAATEQNRDRLLSEGIPAESIYLTGNPVVDSLDWVQESAKASALAEDVAERARGRRMILMTTHRRESFGGTMESYLRALRAFVEAHPEALLVFPVHPNPSVREVADRVLGANDRVLQLPPLEYPDFVFLMSRAWMVCSDSGGVQEEAPSLGVPLLVLRKNTERPEAIQSGVARLVPEGGEALQAALEDAWRPGSWASSVQRAGNPFGEGNSGALIADAIEAYLGA